MNAIGTLHNITYLEVEQHRAELVLSRSQPAVAGKDEVNTGNAIVISLPHISYLKYVH